MTDPYEILQISEEASDEEVKQAYRKLAKKYHPDRYIDSPLSAQANEKMKQVNAAYEQILREREDRTAARSRKRHSYSSSHPSEQRQDVQAQESTCSAAYQKAARMINGGEEDRALQELQLIRPEERTAQWYYLMGVSHYRKGWLEEAFNYIGTAHRMDPDNPEYTRLIDQFIDERSSHLRGFSSGSVPAFSCMDRLFCLLCNDCCCGCFSKK